MKTIVTILAFLLSMSNISCESLKTKEVYEVGVTYFNGDKDTLQIGSYSKPDLISGGELSVEETLVNFQSIRAGVRTVNILPRKPKISMDKLNETALIGTMGS